LVNSGDLGTVEVVEVLDKADTFRISGDEIDDFDVDLTESGDVVEDLTPILTILGGGGDVTGLVVNEVDLAVNAGDLFKPKDFSDGVVGVLEVDFGVVGDCNPLEIVTMFNLSGGGLVTDFLVTSFVVEIGTVFADTDLSSITGFEAVFKAGLFGETGNLLTEVTILVFTGALASGALLDNPDDFDDMFNGEPGDLGDSGDDVFDDPNPVLDTVIGPDFFKTKGNVMMFCNKKNIDII